MTGVAHRLVVDVAGAPQQRGGQGTQAARGVEGLVLDAVQRKGFVAFQCGHAGQLSVDDGLARIAVFVDEPLGAPRQVVAQTVGGIARQCADPHPQVQQGVEAARERVADDADEAGRQAALRHEHAARLVGERLDRMRAGDVFGEVEVMHAGLGT